MTTLAYTRVSTAGQSDHGLSMDAQERAIRDYCALYGLAPVEIIADHGVSAKTVNGRPGLADLLERVSTGEVSAVVCYKTDRMFRSLRDALAVFDLFKAKGVAFHSVMEKWDTSTAMGEFAMNMILSIAQLERRQIGERTSFVLQDKKAQAGHAINGRAPYGYRWSRGHLVQVPEEQAVIRHILALHQAGLGVVNIALRLWVENIRGRRGGTLTRALVSRVLIREARPAHKGDIQGNA